MDISIPLDCSRDNHYEFTKHSSAALAAGKMFNDYLQSKKRIRCIGPEGFAEAWLLGSIFPRDNEFENLIVIYFTKMLLKMNSSLRE